jgi:hypothetical protein
MPAQLIDQHTCSIDFACGLARQCFNKALPQWKEIRRGAEQILAGRRLDPRLNLLLAAVIPRGGVGTEAVVGTLPEIAKEWAPAVSIIGVSLVDAAVTLRQRADKHNIDISAFWDRGK